MWRKLSQEEREVLLANYRFGAYLMRFVMGVWLVFVAFYGIEGIKQLISSLKAGDCSSILSTLLGMCVIGILIAIPCYFIRTTGTAELRALKNDDIRVASAIYVSSEKVYGGGSRRTHYMAKVHIIDAYGNATRTVECRISGGLVGSSREGDRVTVLMPVPDKPEELVCFKKI